MIKITYTHEFSKEYKRLSEKYRHWKQTLKHLLKTYP